MTATYSKKQKLASIKVHQLLLIARDVAGDAGLTALRDDLERLDQEVQYFHKICTKPKVSL